MDVLLEEGLDVNATSDFGTTPMNVAMGFGNIGNIEYLLAKDADPSPNGVVICECLDVEVDSDFTACPDGNCGEKDIEEIKELLGVADGGHENLFDAVVNGDLESVVALIDSGADVNEVDFDNDTPLIIAADRGLVEIAVALLDAGADPDAKGPIGATALHLAAYFGHADVVEVLIQNGATVDIRNDEGFTPLHLASQEGHLKVIKALLAAGADIEKMTRKSGATPLHLAATSNQVDAVALLFEEGADPKVVNDFGLSALHVAALTPGTEVLMALLLEEGLDVNIQTTEGVTPIGFAAYYGNKGGIEFLLSKGANTTIGADSPVFFGEVCGCLNDAELAAARQCPEGSACNSEKDIAEIEEALGGKPGAGTSAGGKSRPKGAASNAIDGEENLCVALPTVLARLECVAKDAEPK
ncbi:unnamed protein product [Ostreobium quekettii]|uniref:Ankyrin repeat domain-containing protein n=1 Tax=Ostreobium quekettii TaxID=121088 RepID=A0A8S1JA89_9CHLO|nr:unnamed protein product [Ostreobium quekettii]